MSQIRERPILFSGPMVKALLAGTKTQTRRLMKPQPYLNFISIATGVEPDGIDGTPYPKGECVCHCDYYPPSAMLWQGGCMGADAGEIEFNPYGVPGERLWVRETWRVRADLDDVRPRDLARCEPWYCATGNGHGDEEPSGCAGGLGKKRPAIFMPRWASRLTLEITEVRVQRLHEISEEDIAAEGVVPICERTPCNCSRDIFAPRWDRIYGKHAPWSSNPWVWAITFRR